MLYLLIFLPGLTSAMVKKNFWENFRNLQSINFFVKYMANNHKDLVQTEIIGTSNEGRKLELLKICENLRCGKKPIIWVDSGIHPREWISPMASTFLIKNLLETGKGKILIKKFDWFILPMVNPDGYFATFNGQRWWRKNKRPDKRCSVEMGDDIADGPGVDLNRNFGNAWQPSEDKACSPNYPGPRAFSEPETRAIRDYLLPKYKSQVVMFNSIHSAGQRVVIPWGHTDQRWEGEDKLAKVLRKGFRAMGEVGKKWMFGNVKKMYNAKAFGGSVNWAAGDLKSKFPFVTELIDKEKYTRRPPKEQILPSVNRFWKFQFATAMEAYRMIKKN